MIVVAGEALVDLVVGPDGSLSAELGGGPFNVARTIGRLGGDVGFLGSISQDRFGNRLLAQLLADGVRIDLISRTDAPTTLAVAELDREGAASYRFYTEGTSAPGVEVVPPLGERLDAVHVGTLGLVLEPIASTIESLLESLPADVLVMVDPNCRTKVIRERDRYLARLQRVFATAHVVKISTDDAEYLAPHLSSPEFAAQLLERGVLAVLITAGGRDTMVVTGEGQRWVPVPTITVADTIGAGDSFGGAFLRAWQLAGLGFDALSALDPVAAAASAANEVAASTCTRVGADPPRLDQLRPGWGRR